MSRAKHTKNAIYAVAFLLFMALALAAEPTVISLQGKLTNSTTGALITSGTIRVNISDTAGNTLWNETFANGVSNGFFDLLLGTGAENPLNLTFNQDYNISVYAGTSVTQIGGTYRFRSSVGQVSPSNLSAGNFSAIGNFSFGSSLFVDKTNQRLGIGTASPSWKVTATDGTVSGFLNPNSNQMDIGAGSNHPLAFLTNNIQRAIFDASGNLGIGTTAPTKKFSVNGTLNALTIDPSAFDPTINTTSGRNITIASSDGSIIMQLG